MTRSQELMKLAEVRVREVEQTPKDVQKIYGALCHAFPVMVRTCGLCQAVAFSLAKAAPAAGKDKDPNDRQKAHELLLKHVAEVLGVHRDQLAKRVQELDTVEYMLATRRILEAWLFFKRFAVSILKVEDARAAQED